MGAVRRFLVLVLISVLCLSGLLSSAGAQSNGPPAGKLKAESAALVTTYTAALADPENNPMYYKWGAAVGCGTFTPSDVETATWDRGAGTPCAPGADAEGMVWVHVTDIISHVGCFYRGSVTGEGNDCTLETEVPRKVRVLLRNKDGKLVVHGTMRLATENTAASLTGCLAGQPMDVQKKKKKRWVTKKTATTDQDGNYSATVADKPGTYRVLAGQVSVAEPSGESVTFFNCVTASSTALPNR